MNKVACDLFRKYHGDEHGEKVSKCLLWSGDPPQCELTERDSDIAGGKERADEKRPVRDEGTGKCVQESSCDFNIH